MIVPNKMKLIYEKNRVLIMAKINTGFGA